LRLFGEKVPAARKAYRAYVERGMAQGRRPNWAEAAYDRDKGFLYVLELYADGAKPVVHVWKVL